MDEKDAFYDAVKQWIVYGNSHGKIIKKLTKKQQLIKARKKLNKIKATSDDWLDTHLYVTRL